MSPVAPSLDDLKTFVAVAQLGSFSRVAQHRDTAASSISTAIARLEKQLGTRLFQRTTRKVVLTQEGGELLGRCERLLEEFDELTNLFRHTHSALSGKLRIDLPLGMAAGMVMELLPQFAAQHSQLTIDVFSTDRRVDVVADGYDCVVRAGIVVDEQLVCRPLGQFQLVNVVSRAYADAFGVPRRLADLAGHHLVNYRPNPSDQPAGFDYLDDKVVRVVAMRHHITVNNSVAYSAACRAGFGIVQVPLVGVRAELASGNLIEVLPDHLPPPMPINLLYPHRRNLPQRVRVFGDWLAGIMQAATVTGMARSDALPALPDR